MSQGSPDQHIGSNPRSSRVLAEVAGASEEGSVALLRVRLLRASECDGVKLDASNLGERQFRQSRGHFGPITQCSPPPQVAAMNSSTVPRPFAPHGHSSELHRVAESYAVR